MTLVVKSNGRNHAILPNSDAHRAMIEYMRENERAHSTCYEEEE
ncbi:MAG: hypothetical protein MOIL_00736 [Candidatus Methanolliviera sp. GoM_oil]|nr:MAG: hypothetical protein MOIL_00736 [Candidatus Methanolliviera sp. GoM_oil]